ncbi:MAG: nucleotidyl transferase AbiEii/AbiGii toxin family protein [Tannerellaceae bacterium]|jgi:hypothetical protein|nr:nucleotidyl transferase AbiEii/AbiGii toxin family protein [Tannerellaceae bacterium]
MLYPETVKRETFELLIALMHDEMLADFHLAGGTALALYLGHRMSIDLDLFTPVEFDALELESHMIEKYNFQTSLKRYINTLKGYIGDVKIDCIAHKYECVGPVYHTKEGIRLYSMKDIAAMKLSAVADNGTRLKDFIDVACLSTKMSLSDMLNAYKDKYPDANAITPYKGLTYFVDINFNEPVVMINGTYKREFLEKRLRNMVNRENSLFYGFPIIKEGKK